MLNNTSTTSRTSQNLDHNIYRQDGPDEAIAIGRYVDGNVVALKPPKTTTAAFRAAVAYAIFRGWEVFPADTEQKKSFLSAEFAPGHKPWGMTNDLRAAAAQLPQCEVADSSAASVFRPDGSTASSTSRPTPWRDTASTDWRHCRSWRPSTASCPTR